MLVIVIKECNVARFTGRNKATGVEREKQDSCRLLMINHIFIELINAHKWVDYFYFVRIFYPLFQCIIN